MPKPERPCDPRAFVNTCVTLSFGLEELGVYRLLDLTTDGAWLLGRCPVPIGQEVMVRLHFSPFEVTVAAVALREDAHGATFGLRFEPLEPAMRDCVDKLVAMTAQWQPGNFGEGDVPWTSEGVLS